MKTKEEKEIEFCWITEAGLCGVLGFLTLIGVLPLPMCVLLVSFSLVSIFAITRWVEE